MREELIKQYYLILEEKLGIKNGSVHIIDFWHKYGNTAITYSYKFKDGRHSYIRNFVVLTKKRNLIHLNSLKMIRKYVTNFQMYGVYNIDNMFSIEEQLEGDN